VTPAERRMMYISLAQTLAALHAVDPEAVGLADFGRPGNDFARQTARWSRQWSESTSRPNAALDAVARWLLQHLPVDDGLVAIVHGDFRIGNMMFHPSEPRVARSWIGNCRRLVIRLRTWIFVAFPGKRDRKNTEAYLCDIAKLEFPRKKSSSLNTNDSRHKSAGFNRSISCSGCFASRSFLSASPTAARVPPYPITLAKLAGSRSTSPRARSNSSAKLKILLPCGALSIS
jgi:hypothetical protein